MYKLHKDWDEVMVGTRLEVRPQDAFSADTANASSHRSPALESSPRKAGCLQLHFELRHQDTVSILQR